MANFLYIANLDSDSSDSETDNSDYEQDEQVNFTPTEPPRQAICLRPLPIFKIERLEPLDLEVTETEVKLLTTITPAPPQPCGVRNLKNPFANVVFQRDIESVSSDQEEDGFETDDSEDQVDLTKNLSQIRDKSFSLGSTKTECSESEA